MPGAAGIARVIEVAVVIGMIGVTGEAVVAGEKDGAGVTDGPHYILMIIFETAWHQNPRNERLASIDTVRQLK